jgi:hypothetical protein
MFTSLFILFYVGLFIIVSAAAAGGVIVWFASFVEHIFCFTMLIAVSIYL